MSSPSKDYRYSTLFDGFASELGSTLDDLAVDWEDNQKHVEPEEKNFLPKAEITAPIAVEDLDDDFGKKLAKPLSFHNPVYKMLHKETTYQKAKRPTLVPLSQLNGGSHHSSPTLGKTEAKSQKQKKNGIKSGFFSKITGSISNSARRHSTSKYTVNSIEHSGTPSTSSRDSGGFQSDGSERYSSEFSSSSNLPSPHKDLNLSNRSIPDIKKVDKVPPTKTPRMSKQIGSLNDLSGKIKVIIQEPQPVVTMPRNDGTSPTAQINGEGILEEKSEVDLSSAAPVQMKATGKFGSALSLSSVSEDCLPSDSEVKTMEDVIGEIALEKKEQPRSPDEVNQPSEGSFVENPGKLKRNKTLRWTGTRKAPVLMKEFSLKQKVMPKCEMYSSTEELESIARKPKVKRIVTPVDSRSCTPSQQTTSFGMGDDEDETSDVIINDDYLSSSENSECVDSPARTSTPTKPVQLRQNRNDVKKSPSHSDSTFIVLSSRLPPAPKLRRTQSSKVRAYLQKLGSNVNNPLGYAVTQFVEETQKDKEKRPLVLLHDIRSFLSDIKHYFISNPHIGLAKKIERIVGKSASVDVDGAVDDALDRLVLHPLHNTVYRCLVVNYTESGRLEIMQEAISLAKRKSNKELGIRKTLIPPDSEAMDVIRGHFTQLQRTYSPYFKLKELLAAVTKIYQSTKDLNVEDQSARKLGADDFLPLLVYSIVHCDFVAADIETQYMDGLLDPTLLLGEGGYYLTTLISAIQVVISIQRKEAALPNISDLQGFLKVGISPSESHPFKKTKGDDANEEVILHKTLHVPPAMTALNLCHMISKKFNVSTPENYCLHAVVNGVPHELEPNDCPQLVKMDLLTQFPSNAFFFSFQRRRDAIGSSQDISEVTMPEREIIETETTDAIENKDKPPDPGDVIKNNSGLPVASDVLKTNQILPKTISDSIDDDSKMLQKESSSDLEHQTDSNDRVTAPIEDNSCFQTDISADNKNVETKEDQIAENDQSIEDAVAIESLVVAASSNDLEASFEVTKPYNDLEEVPKLDANDDSKETISRATSAGNNAIPSIKISSDDTEIFKHDLTLKELVNEHMTSPILNASSEQSSIAILKLDTPNVKDNNNNAFILTSDELKSGENCHQICIEVSDAKEKLTDDVLNNGCNQESDEGSMVNEGLPEGEIHTEKKSADICSDSAAAVDEESKTLVKRSVDFAVSKIHNETRDFFRDETPTHAVKENGTSENTIRTSDETGLGFKTNKNEYDNHETCLQEEVDEELPKRGSIQRHSRRSPVMIRSTRSSFLSASGSDSGSLKRRSCMPRESVATLTEFFEAKTVDPSGENS